MTALKKGGPFHRLTVTLFFTNFPILPMESRSMNKYVIVTSPA